MSRTYFTSRWRIIKTNKLDSWRIQRLVLCWKLQSVTIKENTELRSESNSFSKDGSRSWIRISNGLNRFVRDLTEKVRICGQWAEHFNWHGETRCKIETDTSISSILIFHFNDYTDSLGEMDRCRTWNTKFPKLWSCEEEEHLTSTRTSSSRGRWCDWVQETEIGNPVEIFQLPLIGQFDHGKVTWKESGGHKKRFQYSVDLHFDAILYLRVIQGHSEGTPIDPSLHDNVMIPNDFLKYIYHVENVHDLRSIIYSGLKQEEEMPKKRTTDGILYSRGSSGSAFSRAKRVRPDQGQNCFLQAKVESASECGVLD